MTSLLIKKYEVKPCSVSSRSKRGRTTCPINFQDGYAQRNIPPNLLQYLPKLCLVAWMTRGRVMIDKKVVLPSWLPCNKHLSFLPRHVRRASRKYADSVQEISNWELLYDYIVANKSIRSKSFLPIYRLNKTYRILSYPFALCSCKTLTTASYPFLDAIMIAVNPSYQIKGILKSYCWCQLIKQVKH